MQQQQQPSYQAPPQPTPQFVPQPTPQFTPQTMQPGAGSYAAQTGGYNQPSYNQVLPLDIYVLREDFGLAAQVFMYAKDKASV